MKLTLSDHSIRDGTFRGLNTFVVNDGLAFVVRFTPVDARNDIAIPLSDIVEATPLGRRE